MIYKGVFKSQIFSLTGKQTPNIPKIIYDFNQLGVPPERQKLMAKGAWTGTLKDDADLTTLKIKENQVITLMGTADSLVQAPTEKVSFYSQSSD
jgi:hypothetical protein